MDYKRIHENLVREDHDYRQGWAIKHEIGCGLYLAAGLLVGLVLGVIL